MKKIHRPLIIAVVIAAVILGCSQRMLYSVEKHEKRVYSIEIKTDSTIINNLKNKKK